MLTVHLLKFCHIWRVIIKYNDYYSFKFIIEGDFSNTPCIRFKGSGPVLQQFIFHNIVFEETADSTNKDIIGSINNNTDKIIDNQNQLQENEKNEAETQGQGSVDSVAGAIEDKSAGFVSAIGSLVNSMSYNGTACAWSFPALKLPAIEGVMPEYQLTQEQPIDFEFWVNKIPSDILLLVRSVLTIALIVYCFKELYSTISYVLTLKGGGNSE